MSDLHNRLLSSALDKDSNDLLAFKKQEFAMPADTIYLDGNSLGPLPNNAKKRVKQVVDKEWGEGLITSWNKHQWIDLPEQTGNKIARLIGAEKKQVICCDSISVNLFKLVNAALQLNSPRSKVITTIDNFPTDGYMVQGISALLGDQRCELVSVEESAILEALDSTTAVLLLTQINFRTGVKLDIELITKRAHDVGALVIWDLAHSAGVMPLQLDHWNVDFAVGCGYKFLNGGPGAPAFLYVAKRWHQDYQQPLQGWMGHSKPFAFSPDYQSAKGVQQNLVGTPSIVSMSLLDAALDVFMDVEIEQLFSKAQQLLNCFIDAAGQLKTLEQFNILTPVDENHRGAQIALQHEHAYEICQALIENGVIADFRAPDILRLGFSPLFLSFTDIVNAAICLSDIMISQQYLQPEFSVKQKVT